VPFVYGSESVLLEQPLENGHTHKWSVYVRGIGSEPPPFVVTFKLHETYDVPNRTFAQPPFLVKESGWGEFDIQIKIQVGDKSVQLSHRLQFYPHSVTGEQGTTHPGQVLTSEHYDEVLLLDPPPHVAAYQTGQPKTFTPQLEHQILTQLQQANTLVQTAIHQVNQQISKLSNEHRDLTRKLSME
jgi:YEATS domain-containing protein 4